MVKFVHGSWKRDDTNRQHIEEACERWPSATAIVAYMPEMFGCHHSKVMVLFRHDETAEIVIHTSNMIPGDWLSMTNAVWRSPRLPLQASRGICSSPNPKHMRIGYGARFKTDFLRYLSSYEKKRTGALVEQLALYDFSQVRGAFIASVPARIPEVSDKTVLHTSWGWVGLQEVLSHVPAAATSEKTDPVIVAQVSSVASLGTTSKWLDQFDKVLNTSATPSLRKTVQAKIIFPTPDEIRRSIGGYQSGSSIHMRTTTPTNQKQLAYLRPRLCHWAGDKDLNEPVNCPKNLREAGRRRAAPHIKTFIRFSDERMDRIDWALVSSANLSTQAWGAIAKDSEVRISSYEAGIVIWPGLYDDTVDQSSMVPVFRSNDPYKHSSASKEATVVGFRMPYDLPLSLYTANEEPWCATKEYDEPDWQGIMWKAWK